MKTFKKNYYKWIEETEELNTYRIKKHPSYKELRSFIKEQPDRMKVAGYLISELSDEDFRSEHAMILLKIIARKNIVPVEFRDSMDIGAELWTEWFENIILSETYFK